MLNSNNNNNSNSNSNEKTEESNFYNPKIINNKNTKIPHPHIKNKKIEEPIYIMTVELNKGKNESIKIFKNSKPEEVAYEFCKIHNLDFSSLSYLTEEIIKLVNNLPYEKKEKKIENEPIEEVDEDEDNINQITETSSLKKKINSFEKLNHNYYNYNNNSNFNYFDNDIEKNLNEMNDIQIMDLYNNHRNNEKIDFSGTKGRIDLIEEFNQSENQEKENYQNLNFKNNINNENNNNENFNNNNNENLNENNNENFYIYNEKNDNINNYNDFSFDNNNLNHNYNYGSYKNFNEEKYFNNKKNKKFNRENKKIKEEEKNLSDNFDFYQMRKKVLSYEEFFNNFKNNILNNTNYYKKKSRTNFNDLNKKYKSFNNENKNKRLSPNQVRDNLSNTEIHINKKNDNNNNNIYKKNKYEILNEDYIKKPKKTIYINNKIVQIKKNNSNKKKDKNFEIKNSINNCCILDEVYQNKIHDESIFISKLNSPIHINLNKKKLSLKEFSNSYQLMENKNSERINKSYRKSLSSQQKKKYNKNFFSNLSNSKSERNNHFFHSRDKLKKDNNDNFKNNSFSPSLINSSGLNKRKKIVFFNNSDAKEKNNSMIYKKKNNFYFLKNINLSPNKKRIDIRKLKKKFFVNDKVINDNKNMNNNDYINEKINEMDKKNILRKIFLLLDYENKGYIELDNTKSQKIPIQIIIILSPIFNNFKEKNKISMNEFLNKGYNLMDKISYQDKKILIDFSSKN